MYDMRWSAGKFIFLARLKDQPKGWGYGLGKNCMRRLGQKTGKSLEHYVKHAFQRRPEILQEWSAARADANFLIKEFNDSQQVWQAAYHKMYLRSMPIDYVLGWTPFMGLQFQVCRPTLIPRRDSEFWLRELIQRLQKCITRVDQPLRIYEVGTGTGCLAISLVKNLDNCHVTAIDISSSALALARDNSKKLLSAKQQQRLKFYRQCIFKLEALPEFDLLICNPPYIPNRQFLTYTSASVRHWESPLALVGDHGNINDGTFFHQKLLELSTLQKKVIAIVGLPKIALELNGSHTQALKVQELAYNYGHQNLELVYDEASRPRAIFIT